MICARASVATLALFAIVVAGPIEAQYSLPPDSVVRSIIHQRLDDGRNVGIAVGLIDANGHKRSLAVGPGAGGAPIDEHSVFEIGSITKTFTAAILADMVAKGTVRLDEPVAELLPAGTVVPSRGDRRITLVDLATQSSGLPRMPDNFAPKDPANPYADYDGARLLDYLSRYKLQRDIGSKYEYSNLGVGLLGYSLASKAGMSYERLLTERVLRPLGMSETAITLTPAMRAHLVPGHGANGKPAANWDLDALAGAGAIRSTVSDMEKYVVANMDPRATKLSRELATTHSKRFQTDQPNLSLGLAWHRLLSPSGDTLVWHNGGTAGYLTFIGYNANRHVGVVVLSNGITSVDDIGFHLLDEKVPLAKAPGKHTEITLAPEALQKFVGVYPFTPAFSIAITLEGDKLSAQATSQGKFQLFPEAPGKFFFKVVDAQVEFETDNAGNATALVLVQNGARQRAVRTATTTAAITEADLRQRLFLIADDSMMGRESGSLGDYKTAEYVAAEFKRLGLEPAGDNGTYFQTVPFWSAAVDPASNLDAAGTALQLGRDFVPAQVNSAARTLDDVQTIYGGPVTDSSLWISPAQGAGKVVVFDLPAGASMRTSRYSPARWRTASAVAIVVLDVIGTEAVARLREGRPVSDTARNPNLPPTLWITRSAAKKILGADPATLAPGAIGVPLRGRFDIARTPVPYPARNVVAIVRGSDPALRGEYVSLSAHNDHVGYDHFPVDHDSIRAFDRVIRPMGADSPVHAPSADEWVRIRRILDSLRKVNTPRMDSIRNGADDDGSGTVAILEIAEAMSRGDVRPKRSILFVNHTGEEAGLLGSRWYTDHATVSVDSIVAEIDEDMIGRGWPDDYPRGGTGAASPTYLEVVGAKRLSREFGDSLEAANAREPLPFVFDYSYDVPGHPLQYYCRADHYSYARYGIPSVAFSRGEHLDYHQVTDEAQYINYPGLARVTRMVYSAAMVLANMSHRPTLDMPKPADPHGQCRQ